MTPNRIVAVLTPLVFAPLSGAVAAWIADRVPGIQISETELTGIFVGGALIALAPALQWLHGWQKFEAREAEIQRAVEVAHASAAPAALSASEVYDEFDDEFDDEYDDEFDDEFDDELDEEDLPPGRIARTFLKYVAEQYGEVPSERAAEPEPDAVSRRSGFRGVLRAVAGRIGLS